ncbi:hypothetical protein A2955_03915 [Candidatus Woesebacteria bacterium RIFCSPLOWO2_01_FULL_37_19]|uniref:4-alpha-glucanotransferase n=1 Tax=Candidatus Woesebacteria bacterium RIFCSPLOWO2_01_FULL_37_19 TaxID=1802514 RepID=A0A1F8B8H0_9BACT|nr:MAG: hypothetical protein A2955_03915 [Candidatus Woesebacteria bacterium RIFCSPLOWO2_01_FULL_37_19]
MSVKVLMLGWELPPYNSGGLGEACLGLARALSKNGVEVTFVLPQKVDLNYDFMRIVFADIGEDLKHLQNSYLSYRQWVESYGKDASSSPFDFISGALRYAENVSDIVKKYHSDIIHSHDWLTYPAAIAAKELSRKPMLAHIHSTEIDRTGGHYPNPIVYKIEKDGFENADKVLSVSKYTKNILIDDYAINPNKIDVIYNAIDKVSIGNLPPALTEMKNLGYKVVLFLGRITLMKGPEYFVRAAKRVLEFEKKTIFVVTGSGDMLERMITEATYSGILDKFIFTGFLRGEEKDRIMQAADLFVMPSVSEPFGIVPLEVISNRTPVILSRQCGVSEILNHVLKVDFWDIEEIANKIISVIRYRCLHDDLVNESGKELVNISWDKAAEKCIGIYNQFV